MEGNEYVVNNAQVTGVYSFVDKEIIKGRKDADWRSFYEGSKGPPKITKDVLPRNGKTIKFRVKHATEPGNKQTCKAVSTLSITRPELVETNRKFCFINKPSTIGCTCSDSWRGHGDGKLAYLKIFVICQY